MRAAVVGSLAVGLLVYVALAGCGGGGASGPAPTLTGVYPSSGFTPGISEIRLRGTGFGEPGSSCEVTVGGAAATGVAVLGDAELVCATPPGVPGTVDVAVRKAGGSAELPGAYTYHAYPPNPLAVDVRLDTDAPGAARSENPVIACDGSRTYVVWMDDRNGSEDVYFNASQDSGATWLPADTRLDTDAPGAAASEHPHVSCDGPYVYVVWRDDRSGANDVRFNRSTDGGATWLASDVRLDTDLPGAATSIHTRVCCDGTNVYVSWTDYRNGPSADVYFNRSTDAGATWLATDVQVETDGPGASPAWETRLACDGSNVYVVWEDSRNGGKDVYLNRSLDGGATWLASDVRLDTDAPGAALSRTPIVCCDGLRAYVAWNDMRDGPSNVYANRSTDGGTTWLASDVRLDTDPPAGATSDSVRLCCDGTSVHAVWRDTRDGAGDVRHSHSTDAGATWLAADLRLDTTPPGTAAIWDPQVCCTGSIVYAVWYDLRDGLPDIYLNCSIDGGSSWLASDVRCNANSPGAATSIMANVCCDGARVYVTWGDARDGNLDVYFTTQRP